MDRLTVHCLIFHSRGSLCLLTRSSNWQEAFFFPAPRFYSLACVRFCAARVGNHLLRETKGCSHGASWFVVESWSASSRYVSSVLLLCQVWLITLYPLNLIYIWPVIFSYNGFWTWLYANSLILPKCMTIESHDHQTRIDNCTPD